MTRINIIPPKELMDQHLLAEWREIKMIPASLRRSLKTKSVNDILRSIPNKYVLGIGHVRYFFDKHTYLKNRYSELTKELLSRGFKLYHTGDFIDFCQNIPPEFFNDYTPNKEDFVVIRRRIQEKISMKPSWYRYYGENIV